MAVPDDTTLYPILADLLACLCEEYTSNGVTLCYCGFEPAQGVPIEVGECGDGECGAATVRLVRAYPSVNFPQPDQAGTCVTLLAAEVLVSVYRCVPAGHDDGSGPTAEEYSFWTQEQFADMAAMKRAILCCFGKAHPDTDYVLASYDPLPAQGGLGGGSWRLLIRQEF